MDKEVKISLQDYIAERGLKYKIETYGCQMNVHDSEKIAGILCSLGYQEAEDETSADFILFNTCCVRENAEKRIFGNVGALKQRRLRKKNLVIGVCGCMMQQPEIAEKMARMFPFVNLIFGTQQMDELAQMLYTVLILRKRALGVRRPEGEIIEDIPVRRNAPPLCYIDIMQGCNNFCSYCIVPYVRGRERSRLPEEILREAARLSNEGYREVTLLGQNVNSYGYGFAELLSRVAEETGFTRIRFMTSHPKDLSDDVIAAMAEHENICSQLHLPAQSGSNHVLERMNRRYTREQYLEIVRKVRAALPGVALSTDLIVGFPGETQSEFEETLSLMNEVRFDSAYTFVYSPRQGTRAAKFPDQISEEIKQSRIIELVERQRQITYETNLKYVGKILPVLVEGESKRGDGTVAGRTETGKMVNFTGEERLIGDLIPVEITEAKTATLFGKRV